MGEFSNTVNSISNEYKTKRQQTSNYDELVNYAVEELGKYSEIIPKFFSARGEANGIRNMYNSLEERPNDIRVIKCIDLCKAGFIYMDYINGMLKFISEVFSTAPYANDNSQYEMYKQNVDTAIAKNDEFVNSLFGGNNNEATDKSLREATVNIEYLIDFRTNLDNFIKQSKNLIKPACQSEMMCGLINDSVRLYFNSVGFYCASVLNCVFSTYDSICDALKYPYGKPVEPQTPTYQLF